MLTAKDWTEIFYAVELKRMHVAQDNRENGRFMTVAVRKGAKMAPRWSRYQY